jgi:hypothetical protein
MDGRGRGLTRQPQAEAIARAAGRRRHLGSVASMESRTPRAARFRRLVESRCQGLYASRDVVAGRTDLFGRTAESVVTYWPGGIRAGVEVALAPCPGSRVRSGP